MSSKRLSIIHQQTPRQMATTQKVSQLLQGYNKNNVFVGPGFFNRQERNALSHITPGHDVEGLLEMIFMNKLRNRYTPEEMVLVQQLPQGKRGVNLLQAIRYNNDQQNIDAIESPIYAKTLLIPAFLKDPHKRDILKSIYNKKFKNMKQSLNEIHNNHGIHLSQIFNKFAYHS